MSHNQNIYICCNTETYSFRFEVNLTTVCLLKDIWRKSFRNSGFNYLVSHITIYWSNLYKSQVSKVVSCLWDIDAHLFVFFYYGRDKWKQNVFFILYIFTQNFTFWDIPHCPPFYANHNKTNKPRCTCTFWTGGNLIVWGGRERGWEQRYPVTSIQIL